MFVVHIFNKKKKKGRVCIKWLNGKSSLGLVFHGSRRIVIYQWSFITKVMTVKDVLLQNAPKLWSFSPFLGFYFFITWPANAITQIHYWFKWKREKQSANIVTKVKHDICSALCTESEKRIIFYAQIYYEGLNGITVTCFSMPIS